MEGYVNDTEQGETRRDECYIRWKRSVGGCERFNRIVKVYENMIKDKVILMSIYAGCVNKCLKAERFVSTAEYVNIRNNH